MAPRQNSEGYDGPFEPGFRWSQLSRDTLARLGREIMLFAHFHDRGLMPLLASRFTAKAMTDVACDEWIGASPVYSRRCRDLLGVGGNGVSAVFKAFQLDVGFPHQYMDVHYELVDETLGYFWLPFCGAYEDVFRFARGREEPIVRICHHMEDPTFPATVGAVNPRLTVTPVHRPPLRIGHTGPTCRWQVALGEGEGRAHELPLTEAIRASRAARFRFDEQEGEPGPGLADYAGPFRPDFVLEDLAQAPLARLCQELALDVHLLMRAAFTSVRERFGAAAATDLAREQWSALAPVVVPRLREAAGIEGDDVPAILKTLQLDPAFPPGYVRIGAEVLDARRGRFWVEDCEAVQAGEPAAWLALLLDAERPGFDAVVAAINPRARVRSGGRPLHWEIEIDPEAEPRPESPLANVVRASNVAAFRFR
jgi:hypothetical protein